MRLSGKRTTSQMNHFDWIVSDATLSVLAADTLQDADRAELVEILRVEGKSEHH